jgi:hypothetical protein
MELNIDIESRDKVLGVLAPWRIQFLFITMTLALSSTSVTGASIKNLLHPSLSTLYLAVPVLLANEKPIRQLWFVGVSPLPGT